jgi:hypothetical protein
MPTQAQLENLNTAITQLRAAENSLLVASRTTNDLVTLGQINNEYSALDTILSQILQAQLISDDASFQIAAATFKQEVATLGTQAAAISKIVTDVGTAASIAGAITNAATAIAAL